MRLKTLNIRNKTENYNFYNKKLNIKKKKSISININYQFISIIILFFFNSKDLFSLKLPSIYKYETLNSEIIYIGKGHSYLIPHIARTFENTLDYKTQFWDYTQNEKTIIFIHDLNDMGYAGAIVTPKNMLLVGVNPLDYIYDFSLANERFQWLMNHEYTHLVMGEKATKSDNIFRNIFFGKVFPENNNPLTMVYAYLTTPRWYSPRWFHEGIAIFMETWMSGGVGRALGGYDEMVFRTMVDEEAYFYNVVGLESEGTTIDFQVGVNAYLYGARFINWLTYEYGFEKLLEFYNRTNDSKRFYANQFKKVYGDNVETQWSKWIEFEKTFQTSNIEIIENLGESENEPITKEPLGAVAVLNYDEKLRSIITAVNYPNTLPYICSINIDDGEITKIADVLSPVLNSVTNITYNSSEQIIFTSENNRNYRELHSIDLKTGKRKKLIDITRTGYLTFNPSDNSIWGIQVFNGRQTLVRIKKPYKDIERIYSIPFGNSLFDLSISSDGVYMSATYSLPSGVQKLVLYKISSLLNSNFEYEELYEFEDNSASNFTFTTDNQHLVGTSYYTGVSNIFSINIHTKEIEILTNAKTGFFKPIQIHPDTLIALKYTHKGMHPVKIPINPPQRVDPINYLGQLVYQKNSSIADLKIDSHSKLDTDSITIAETEYNSYKNLKLNSIVPMVTGYKDFPVYGLQFNLRDLILINSINFSYGYSPNQRIKEKERHHFALKWKLIFWEFNLSYNKSDFYDLFGPTKVSRAGYSYSAKYQNDIIRNKFPEKFYYSIELMGFGGLDRMPLYQNIETSENKFYYANFNLTYSNMRKSLGAIEDESGFDISLSTNFFYVANDFIPQLNLSVQRSFLLPLKNSTFRTILNTGNSFGQKQNSFNNFYFGGFGNNYLDYKPQMRYREFYSFPGVKLNSIAGEHFAKLLTEWNLPPIRFKKFGFLNFYTTYSRFSLFSSALATNFAKANNANYVLNIGCQLDFELVVFSLLKSYLSFGFASAFKENSIPSREFMISLKFL